MKRFAIWFGLKEKLEGNSKAPPLVSEHDIWWANVGENIGSEISGKSDLFSRPVIILKKLSHTFYFVIPTTTKHREGSWYVAFVQRGKHMCACLHQARAIDYRRLSSKLGTLDDEDFARVKKEFSALYIKQYSPPFLVGPRENPECVYSVHDLKMKSTMYH